MKPIESIKIAISGKSGCGNTTVSRLVAGLLGIRLINFTFRNLAEERGLSLAEVLEAAKRDDSWDKETDARQIALARDGVNGYVLGSRLAIWLLPEADVSVYLAADISVRARRIFQREGGRYEDVERFTQKRDREDNERYKRIYQIDNDVYDFAGMVVDAGAFRADEIAARIAARARALCAA